MSHSLDRELPEDKMTMSPPCDRESQGTEAMFPHHTGPSLSWRTGLCLLHQIGALKEHSHHLLPPQQFPDQTSAQSKT